MTILRRASHWLLWVARGSTGSSAVVQTVMVRILMLVTTVFSGVIVARALGPTGRGIQGAMALWPALLSGLLTMGVPVGLRYHARKHPDDQASIYSAAIVLTFLLGIVATVVGVVGIPHWLAKYDERNIRLAQWLMTIAPIAMLTFVLSAILEVRFDFTSSNILRYSQPIFVLLGLLALLASHRLTPFNSAVLYTVAPFPVAAVLAFRLRKAFKFTLEQFQTSARRLLSYGIRIYISDVLSIFGTQIDQLLVVGLLSAENLGTYTVALTASRALNVFQASVTVVLLPKATGLEPLQIVAMVGRAARVSTALTLASGLLLVLTLPFILPHLYGRDFAAAVVVSQILTVESVLACTTIVLVQTFMATNRPGMATFLQLAGLALAIPLMLVLIPRFGLAGAALALLASTVARLTVALLCYPILLKLPAPSLLLGPSDIAYVRDVLRQRRPR